MYRRFLNDNDYLSVITKDALNQMTKNNPDKFAQAEESAEISILEYLSENYEVASELNKGKYIAQYNRMITYPVGVHIYFNGTIHEVIRSISGYIAPSDKNYWEELEHLDEDLESIPKYSQLGTYYPNDTVIYNGGMYICSCENGFKFNNIRIPNVTGWKKAEFTMWQPKEYNLWEVVLHEGAYFTLISLEGFDNNIAPDLSDNWGEIADYDPKYNKYELSEHEYVIYNDTVFYPEINVNSDQPQLGTNLTPGDPRNLNLKKHMVRLAIYELTKSIAPNNVSVVRIRDYEDSMKWLMDASKLRLNPMIPRKLAEDKKPVMDWQISTFQTEYNPYNNPWMV